LFLATPPGDDDLLVDADPSRQRAYPAGYSIVNALDYEGRGTSSLTRLMISDSANTVQILLMGNRFPSSK
jgi:hypothetical protein